MSFEEYGKGTIAVGPWGGQDGFHWDDGVNTTVRQLEIAYGAGIDSIRIEYDRRGCPVWSERHGGHGGPKTDKVKLDYPNEYLTSIHGYYGSINEWGPVFVRSLTFESNKRTFGPYGIEQGTYFSLPMAGGKIVGLHGRCGWYVDAIGAYLEPLIHRQPDSNQMVQYSQSHNYVVSSGTGTEKWGYSMMQANLANNYDLFIALKHKDIDYVDSPPKYFSRQTSNSRDCYSDLESKPKISGMLPSTIERVPSKSKEVEGVASTKAQGVVTYGPWGGNGGTVFDDGVYDGIKQINISRNVGIVYIKVCYVQNGQDAWIWGNRNGGTGGFKSDKILLDYPSEILTHVTGFYGPTMIMGPKIIKSIAFQTTKRKYGPYGEEEGQPFSSNLREGRIVGFHGRKGLFLDAIGLHVIEGKVNKQATSLSPSPSNSFNQLVAQPSISNEVRSNRSWPFKLARRGISEQGEQRVVHDPTPCGTGPWGGEGGRPWDDGVFSGVKQIILTRSADGICSIEMEYDRSGQSVWSVKHGGNNGQTTHKIKLEHPDEVITCVSGYYGATRRKEASASEGTKAIKSLTLITSRGKLGPYGEESGTYFTSSTTKGKVVGFHGRSSQFYLDAIGVHMQHWLGNHPSKPASSSSLSREIFQIKNFDPNGEL